MPSPLAATITESSSVKYEEKISYMISNTASISNSHLRASGPQVRDTATYAEVYLKISHISNT